jgi:hypothetical protein
LLLNSYGLTPRQQIMLKYFGSYVKRVPKISFRCQRSSGVEQRFPNSRLGMPMSDVRYKLELLCYLLKPCFVRNILFGDNPSFSV